MARLVVSLPLLAIGVLLGCVADPPSSSGKTSPPSGCPALTWEAEDGTCLPAGLPPDMPCPPGEAEREGGCVPAGVAPDGCGAGFVHDGNRGCAPILPPADCPLGKIAVPGDTACRDVAPCAAGAWGDIPVAPDTEHVDGSFVGVSDGSPAQPWTTIGAAVAAAAPGAIVAVAAGSYVEDVVVLAPVRIWGRCPSMVEIVAKGGQVAAVFIQDGANGTELRDLAIRGPAIGVMLSGSTGVVMERLWVHGTADRGVNLQNSFGPTGATLRGSLIEKSRASAVFVGASELVVEASVIRDTLSVPQGPRGVGLDVEADPKGVPSNVTLRGSLVDNNREHGVFIGGSEVLIEASVIRRTRANGLDEGGRGVNMQGDLKTGAPSKLTLRTSLVEQNREIGVFISGSDAVVESSVIRDTVGVGPGAGGRGVQVQPDEAPASLTLRTSVVDNHDFGILALGSKVVVDASAIRSNLPVDQGGPGLQIQAVLEVGTPADLLMTASLVDSQVKAGIVVLDSTATIDASVIRNTRLNVVGLLGDGMVAVALSAPTRVTLTRTRLEQSGRAALSTFGALLQIGSSELACQAFDLFGADQEAFPFAIEDLGGNLCGCPEAAGVCVTTGVGLAPPPPVGGVE